MKYIILCGGIGKETTNYSLPKPLNLIQGRHMIEYIIDNIPSNEIFIIYNILLDEYNFQEILINKCKPKKIHFSQIDYLTRGAVETAFVGINKFIEKCDNDNIVFIDNDNLYNLSTQIPYFESEFIGYSINYSNNTNKNYDYPFICFDSNNKITSIEDKNNISNFYCCGFYGFQNVNNFLKYAKILFDNDDKYINKFCFSSLYNIIIKHDMKIVAFFIEDAKHIETYSDMIDIDINNTVPKKILRICFDLDNTLVTYPTIAGDYTTVKPINRNIMLLKKMKKEGHEIIIYTARRMKTHDGNVGKVIKDIARDTIDTLDKFNIEYDELIFGKPIADIYIDDRAINPYINDISYFGLFNMNSAINFIPNKIKNNKYNKIEKYNEYIIKTGPFDILNGELFYYKNIPKEFENYFPKLIDYNKKIYTNEIIIELKIDYIEGIPLYFLYKNCLLTYKHIDELFDILNNLHSYSKKKELIITDNNIKNNYVKKLNKRFNIHDYYFEDANDVLIDIIEGIEAHYSPVISYVIHGDLWFSNIILTYQNNYKFVDMKGSVDDILTLSGDIYYDYGKLYQSILGYDLVLNDCEINNSNREYIQSMKLYFLKKCDAKGLNINYLTYVTKGLVFGVYHSITHYEQFVKNNIWKFIKDI